MSVTFNGSVSANNSLRLAALSSDAFHCGCNATAATTAAAATITNSRVLAVSVMERGTRG